MRVARIEKRNSKANFQFLFLRAGGRERKKGENSFPFGGTNPVRTPPLELSSQRGFVLARQSQIFVENILKYAAHDNGRIPTNTNFIKKKKYRSKVVGGVRSALVGNVCLGIVLSFELCRNATISFIQAFMMEALDRSWKRSFE